MSDMSCHRLSARGRPIGRRSLRRSRSRPSRGTRSAPAPNQPTTKLAIPALPALGDLEISLGKGMGDLVFGAAREEVEKILGVPDEVALYDYLGDGDEMSSCWRYRAADLELIFQEDDGYRLGEIQCSSPGLSLRGAKLIGLERDVAIAEVASIGLGAPKLEELTDESAFVTYEAASPTLTSWVGTISAMSWQYFWLDSNTPLWPEEK